MCTDRTQVMMFARMKFLSKSEIIYKWAVFPVPTELRLLSLLNKVHRGKFKIFWDVLFFFYFFEIWRKSCHYFASSKCAVLICLAILKKPMNTINSNRQMREQNVLFYSVLLFRKNL